MALPTGFRFQPTDQELLVCYLRRKIHNLSLPCNVIKEIELLNHDPWEIRRLGEKVESKCYFFNPTVKNNWKCGRPNRVANNGHWKPTARYKPIYDNRNKKVGIKKSLVFKNLRGKKTNWLMDEYMITKVCEMQMMLLGKVLEVKVCNLGQIRCFQPDLQAPDLSEINFLADCNSGFKHVCAAGFHGKSWDCGKLDKWVLRCIYKKKRNQKKKRTSNSEVKRMDEDDQNLPTNIRKGDQETTCDADNERNADEDSFEGQLVDLGKLVLH